MNDKLFGKPIIEHDFGVDIGEIVLLPFDHYNHAETDQPIPEDDPEEGD